MPAPAAAERAAEEAEIDDAPTIFVGKTPPGEETTAPRAATDAGAEQSAHEDSDRPAQPTDQLADTGRHRAPEAPAAPAVDDSDAAGDAATAHLPVAEQPAPQPTEGDPTQQFPAGTSTRQMPQWGGVPQGGPGPQPPAPGSQPPAPGSQVPPPAQPPPAQGPASSQAPPPPQQQWGTGPAAGGPGQFGAASSAPYAGAYQQGAQPPPGAAPPAPAGMPPQSGGSYSAAPPPGSGPQFGGPASGQQFQQAGPFGPGDAPSTKNRTPLIVGGIVAAIVIVLLVVLAVRLIGGDDESSDADATAPVTAPSTDPADDPTTPAPSDDPSDEPTDEPTDQQSDSPDATGNLTVLAPGEPAVVAGVSGEPEVEVALISAERGWQPEGSQGAICPDPEGEYLALEFEFTTLPALADGSGTYSFVGFEVGLANENGTTLEASGVSGLFCLGSDQQAPSEMGPGETFTGWAVVDAPAEASHVLWQPWLDFTGQQPTYAWSIADF